MSNFRILLGLGIVFFVQASHELQAQSHYSETQGYSLLWEITGPELAEASYLFGTMHVRDKRAFEFPDSVLIALDKCDALATEVYFDSLYTVLHGEELEKRVLRQFYELDEDEDYELDNSMEQSGTSSADNRSFSFSRKDITTRRFDKLESLLNIGAEEDLEEVFLDAYLFQRAKNLGKDLYGLEKIKKHYENLPRRDEGIDSDLNRTKLDVLDSISEVELPDLKQLIGKRQETLDLLTTIYQHGEISKVEEFSKKFYGDSKKKEWLTDRNWDMLHSMMRIMPKQSLFAAVGCAHLPGEDGLLDLLTRHGYSVRRVIPNNSGLTKRKREEKLIDKWELFVNENSGFQVEVPASPHDIDLMAGLKMHMVQDMIREDIFIFYGLPCAIAGIDPKDPNRYERLIELLKNEGRITEVISRKKIKHDGWDGYEANVAFEHDDIEMSGWLRTFTANQFMYVFLAMQDSEETNNRFFESLQFLDPKASEKDDDEQRFEPQAGFKATMPGLYQKEVIELPIDAANPELKVKLFQFIASDLKTNSMTAVVKTDLAPGMYFDNDSTSLLLVMSEYDPNIQLGEEFGTEFLLKNGIYGFQPNLVLRDRTMRFLVRSYVRGPSYYTLLYQAPEDYFTTDKANSFFESVKFLEFMPEDLSVKQIDEVNVLLANDPISAESDAYYNDVQFVSNDYFPNTNISVSLFKEPLSKYIEPQPLDSIFKNYSAENLYWQEEVLRESVLFNSEGDSYLDLLIARIGASTLERRIVYYKNEAYYTFCYFMSPELKDDRWLDEIVSQTTIDNLDVGLTKDERRQNFYRDLLSDDQELYEGANYSIYQMAFDNTDIDELNAVLLQNFEFDGVDETASVHSKILSKLADIETEASIEVIRNYFTTTENDFGRLDAFILLKENHWTDLNLSSVIESNLGLDGYQFEFQKVFEQEFKDSIAQFIDHIPSYLEHYMGHSPARNALLNKVRLKNDTLIKNGFDVEDIVKDLRSCMTAAVDSIEYSIKVDSASSYAYWQHSTTLENAIVIVEHMDDSGMRDFIYNIPYQKYDISPSSYLEYRIVQGDDISEEEWKHVETMPCDLYGLVGRIAELDLNDAVPQQYQKEDKLTEMAFQCLMLDDWGEIKILKAIGSDTIHPDGDEVAISSFLFTSDYDPEIIYIGFVETTSQSSVHKQDVWSLYYDYRYTEVTEDDYETVLRELVEAYE